MAQRIYIRKRAYRHSCAPSFIPFTADGCTGSHAPVFVAHHSQRAHWTGDPAKVSARASSASKTPRFRTAVFPSWRQADWSAVRISSWPLSAATRCPVMTQDAVQFSGSVFVVSGRASPACFTGRRVTPLPGVPYPWPWKRAGIRVYCSTCSTGPKLSPMPGGTRCTDAHSCWSDFCSTA